MMKPTKTTEQKFRSLMLTAKGDINTVQKAIQNVASSNPNIAFLPFQDVVDEIKSIKEHEELNR